MKYVEIQYSRSAKRVKRRSQDNLTVNKSTAALLKKLKKLTAGLQFQSESDYPVEPLMIPANEEPSLSAQEIVERKKKSTAGGAVRELDLDQFFSAATEEQDWHGPEEREAVTRFQTLVKTLKENLSDIKVYRIGEVEADVYVVGRTTSGDFAGVSTRVVET